MSSGQNSREFRITDTRREGQSSTSSTRAETAIERGHRGVRIAEEFARLEAEREVLQRLGTMLRELHDSYNNYAGQAKEIGTVWARTTRLPETHQDFITTHVNAWNLIYDFENVYTSSNVGHPNYIDRLDTYNNLVYSSNNTSRFPILPDHITLMNRAYTETYYHEVLNRQPPREPYRFFVVHPGGIGMVDTNPDGYPIDFDRDHFRAPLDERFR